MVSTNQLGFDGSDVSGLLPIDRATFLKVNFAMLARLTRTVLHRSVSQRTIRPGSTFDIGLRTEMK